MDFENAYTLTNAHPDYMAAADFLVRWCSAWKPDWWLNLCAIPASSGAPVGRSWIKSDVHAKKHEIAAWIKQQNDMKANVYFTYNPISRPVSTKPTKKDIAAQVALGIDIDPPDDGHGYQSRCVAVLDIAARLLQPNSTPKVGALIFSGNGIQVFYLPPQPLAVDEMEVTERVCQLLHTKLGQGVKTDGTWNADRLMRVPQTLNWPNSKKLSKGYPSAPSTAEVVSEKMLTIGQNEWLNLVEDAHSVSVTHPTTKNSVARAEAKSLRESVDGESSIIESLVQDWRNIAVPSKADELDPALHERLRDLLERNSNLLCRWRGETSGLNDTSRSGLLMSLISILRRLNLSLHDTARIAWVYEHGGLQDITKYGKPRDAARAIARAWLNSDPTQATEDGNPFLSGSLPRGYSMRSSGLFFTPDAAEKEANPKSLWLAEPHKVTHECGNEDGSGSGLVVRWTGDQGAERVVIVDRSSLHLDFRQVPALLDDKGLRCAATTNAHQLLRNYFNLIKVPFRALSVNRGGWHGNSFVLADGTVFDGGSTPVVLRPEVVVSDPSTAQAGSLGDWKDNVARYAVGNDRIAMSMCAAFAGPLLELTNLESGGVHLVGQSRSGKTSALRCAGSVWGMGDSKGQVRQWRVTANGLEGIAAATSDSVLILDEIGQASADQLHDIIYMLANEAGKQRANHTGGARVRKTWRSMFISSGEVTVENRLTEVGRTAPAGLQVRRVNLQADAGAGMGVFQNLHGFQTPAELAEHLKMATRTYYGTAARKFLNTVTQLMSENDELQKILKSLMNQFVATNLPRSADGQVRTVAMRFALLAAAGELACEAGVLPWPVEEPSRAASACFKTWLSDRGDRAASACFKTWLSDRGDTEPAENRQALEQVKRFLVTHGDSRFERIAAPTDRDDEDSFKPTGRVLNRVGWKRLNKDRQWEYLIHPRACGQLTGWLPARGLL